MKVMLDICAWSGVLAGLLKVYVRCKVVSDDLAPVSSVAESQKDGRTRCSPCGHGGAARAGRVQQAEGLLCRREAGEHPAEATVPRPPAQPPEQLPGGCAAAAPACSFTTMPCSLARLARCSQTLAGLTWYMLHYRMRRQKCGSSTLGVHSLCWTARSWRSGQVSGRAIVRRTRQELQDQAAHGDECNQLTLPCPPTACRHAAVPAAGDVHAALGPGGGPLVPRHGHLRAAVRCVLLQVFCTTRAVTLCSRAASPRAVGLNVLAPLLQG